MSNLESEGAKPRLIPGWRAKLMRLWSMQVAWFGVVFWSAITGLYLVWPAFASAIPLWFFAGGGVAMSIALGVARVLKQPGLDQ